MTPVSVPSLRKTLLRRTAEALEPDVRDRLDRDAPGEGHAPVDAAERVRWPTFR